MDSLFPKQPGCGFDANLVHMPVLLVTKCSPRRNKGTVLPVGCNMFTTECAVCFIIINTCYFLNKENCSTTLIDH